MNTYISGTIRAKAAKLVDSMSFYSTQVKINWKCLKIEKNSWKQKKNS